MAFIPGYKGRILAGSFSYSAYVTDITPSFNVDMLDVTTMVNTAKVFIPGQNTSTLGLKGYLDPTATSNLQYDQIQNWTGAQAISYGPSGTGIGSELLMRSGLESKFEITSSVSTPVAFSLDTQSTGQSDRGVCLHDLTAETANGSATSVDGGAQSTNGAAAHLHVTAYSGFTSVVINIDDSANNSTFASLSGGTFTTVTGLTSERLAITGTVRQYTRATIAVTGTGSITYVVGFARR